VHDLAAAKLIAGRERDLDFVSILVQERMVDAAFLRDRLAVLPAPQSRVAAAQAHLRLIEAAAR
jgi:hypothetical protein